MEARRGQEVTNKRIRWRQEGDRKWTRGKLKPISMIKVEKVNEDLII